MLLDTFTALLRGVQTVFRILPRFPEVDVEQCHPIRKTVIILNSICDLMHALALKAHGYNVHILDSRDADEIEEDGASVSIGKATQKLLEHLGINSNSHILSIHRLLKMDRQGTIVEEVALPSSLWTMSGKLLHNLLKKEFLEECDIPSDHSYQTCTRIMEVLGEDNKVTVTFERNGDRKRRMISAENMIRTKTVQTVLQQSSASDVKSKHTRYIVWRGAVSENVVPLRFRSLFDGSMAMCSIGEIYIFAYPVPGNDGNTNIGHRLLEWVWYEPCVEDSFKMQQVMTDSMEHRHRVTVPKRYVNEKVWREQVSHAENIIPIHFAELIRRTGSPSVTALTHLGLSLESRIPEKLVDCGDVMARPDLFGKVLCEHNAFRASPVSSADVFIDQSDLNEPMSEAKTPAIISASCERHKTATLSDLEELGKLFFGSSV